MVKISTKAQIFPNNTPSGKFHVRILSVLINLAPITKVDEKERAECMEQMNKNYGTSLKPSTKKNKDDKTREDLNNIIVCYTDILKAQLSDESITREKLHKICTKFMNILKANDELKDVYQEFFHVSLAISGLKKSDLIEKICGASRVIVWSIWNGKLDGKKILKYFKKDDDDVTPPVKKTPKKDPPGGAGGLTTTITKSSKSKKKVSYDLVHTWLKKNPDMLLQFEKKFEK